MNSARNRTLFAFRLPVVASLAALLLSACVDTSGVSPANAPTEALLDQPPINTDATIYAARADGQFAIPGLPVEQIPESHRRQVVDYPTEQAPGTIIIDPTTKLLYYVLGKNKALRYGISVGAEGFQWSGEAIVSRKREWPTWTPPAEMIDRKPSLEKWRNGQPGGPTNPLGSRAIYLTSNGVDYGYRIHGTPEWKTIGRNASSGCFRMINQDVMDLFTRVKGGEKVIVLTAKGEMPNKLNIPKPPAPKKKAVEAPKVETPALTMMGPPPGLIGPTPADVPAGDTPPEAAVAPATPGAPLALPTAAPVITPGTLPATVPAPVAPAAETPAPAAAPAPVTPAPATPAPVAPAATPVAPSAPAAAAPVCAVPLVNGSCPG